MELRLPKEVIDYLDAVRGEKSRQAFIVNVLVLLAKGKLAVAVEDKTEESKTEAK